jgi:hypothetical protein
LRNSRTACSQKKPEGMRDPMLVGDGFHDMLRERFESQSTCGTGAVVDSRQASRIGGRVQFDAPGRLTADGTNTRLVARCSSESERVFPNPSSF